MIPFRCRVDGAIKGYSAFPTIRLFSVISRTLVGGVLPLCREVVGVFYSPSLLGKDLFKNHLSSIEPYVKIDHFKNYPYSIGRCARIDLFKKYSYSTGPCAKTRKNYE